MSKCKAVMDSQKITEIKVRTKPPVSEVKSQAKPTDSRQATDSK